MLHVDELVFAVCNAGDGHDFVDPAAWSLIGPDDRHDETDGLGDERAHRRSADFRDELFQPPQPARAWLAWTVQTPPGWPVFQALRSDSASPPRTSPTMIRSGRSRMVAFSSRCISTVSVARRVTALSAAH